MRAPLQPRRPHHRALRAALITSIAVLPAPARAEVLDLLAHLRDYGEPLDLALANPWQLAITPDGKYGLISAQDDDRVTLVLVDEATGAVAQRRNAGIEVPRPTGIAVSPDSQHIYVGAFDEDALHVLAVEQTLTGPGLELVSKVPNGLGPVTELDGPIAVVVSPDGAHVYVAAATTKTLHVFARNPATGALTWVEREKSGVGGVVGLDGVWSLAFSADGRSLYGATPLTDYLVAFRRDPATGALTFQGTYRDGVNGISSLDQVQSVVVRPGDEEVWVSGAEGITIFDRAPTGLLELRGTFPFINYLVSGLAFSPDGTLLALTSEFSLLALRLDGIDAEEIVTGISVASGGVEALAGLRSPVFGPELAALHAIAQTGDSVISIDTALRRAVYLRDGRFRVEATYTVSGNPPAAATPQRLTDDTTVFSFRAVANKELVLKVLDGCGINDRFWVFSGGLTNLAVTITVTDTMTGAMKTYANPQGTAFPPKLDTAAFATCP